MYQEREQKENGEDEEKRQEREGKKSQNAEYSIPLAAFFIFSHSSLIAYPHKSE